MNPQLCERVARRIRACNSAAARAVTALIVLALAGCATTSETPPPAAASPTQPAWQTLLQMPAEAQTAQLTQALATIPSHALRPAPELLVKQPGDNSPQKRITAARNDDGKLLLVYTPEQQTIELRQRDLPRGFKMEWLNPHDGKRSGVVGVVNADNLLLTPPAPGDWVLLVTGK